MYSLRTLVVHVITKFQLFTCSKSIVKFIEFGNLTLHLTVFLMFILLHQMTVHMPLCIIRSFYKIPSSSLVSGTVL